MVMHCTRRLEAEGGVEAWARLMQAERPVQSVKQHDLTGQSVSDHSLCGQASVHTAAIWAAAVAISISEGSVQRRPEGCAQLAGHRQAVAEPHLPP